MKKALGIDIGGTKILYGIVNENGEIVSEVKKNIYPQNSRCDFFYTKNDN